MSELPQELWQQARDRLRGGLRAIGGPRGRHAQQQRGEVTPAQPPAEPASDAGALDRNARMFDAGDGQRAASRGNGHRRPRRADDGARETPMVPRASFSLLLRAAGPQDAGVEGRHRLLLLPGRPRRRLLPCSRRART